MEDNREYDQMFPPGKIPQGHDVAQICLNGHVVNAAYNSCPQYNEDYCSKCGERTITSCEECKKQIRGHEWGSCSRYIPPKYCDKCGAAYPWTERILEAAAEMLNLEGKLMEEDKKALSESVPDLVRDTPKSNLAVLILKRLRNKIAPPLYKFLVDVASETNKKLIEDVMKGGMS
jgi:hypothetical protein